MAIVSNVPKTGNAKVWLKKLSRGSAWALLIVIIILLVSGWGITQTGVIYSITFGLIDRGLADSIHRAANIPLVIFFLVHVMTNIKLATLSKRLYLEWIINGILIAVGIGLLIIVVYLEYFRIGG